MPSVDHSDSALANVSDEQRLGWLRDMMLIREFELRTMQSYQQAKIGGFCHVYIGQEAVAVGCVAARNPKDPIITAYRDHGHSLACGTEPKYVMAEMFGKVTGCAKGKGGSMHLFDKRYHMYGGHAIVGGQTPLGVGLAFATKYENDVLAQGEPLVTQCFLGDGALNQGALHEAMNLAAVLEVPCIFIVENNGYSMGTSIGRGTSASEDLRVKAHAYGMEGHQLDGMDVTAVYGGMKAIVDKARETQKPDFVDIRTYRYKGHSMSDPQKYRSKDEVNEYEAGDPIRKLADALMESDVIDEDRFKALGKEIRDEVREALKFAEDSPEPDVATDLYSDVCVEPFGPYLPTSLPEMLEDDGSKD